MAGAELLQEDNAPDGFRREILAPGTTGELEILVPNLGEPEPGIIDLAPENPVAPHIVPRHEGTEIERWMASEAIRQRAADRRLSKTPKETEQPKHLKPVKKEETEPLKVVLDEESLQYLSEERRQEKIEAARLAQLRELPFAKGMQVQASSEELIKADKVLQQHSRTFNSHNKRFIY